MGTEGLLGVSPAFGSGLAGSLGGLLLQLVPLHAVQEVGSGIKKEVLDEVEGKVGQGGLFVDRGCSAIWDMLIKVRSSCNV